MVQRRVVQVMCIRRQHLDPHPIPLCFGGGPFQETPRAAKDEEKKTDGVDCQVWSVVLTEECVGGGRGRSDRHEKGRE